MSDELDKLSRETSAFLRLREEVFNHDHSGIKGMVGFDLLGDTQIAAGPEDNGLSSAYLVRTGEGPAFPLCVETERMRGIPVPALAVILFTCFKAAAESDNATETDRRLADSMSKVIAWLSVQQQIKHLTANDQ